MNEQLSSYFKGVASRVLTPVEVDPNRSNQHELQGSHTLKQILGEEKRSFEETTFFYFDEDPLESVTCKVNMTWYDSRRNQPSRSPEYRLYYQPNEVFKKASAGDLLVVALTPEDKLFVFVAREDTSAEQQLAWLFNISKSARFKVKATTNEAEVGFVKRYILEQLGIDTSKHEFLDEDALEKILSRFGEAFPTTVEFSAYARETLNENISPNPDEAIIQCVEREEALFRLLEKHIVQKQLDVGFTGIDDFASFAKSWLNRRYARAGHCFENHLKYIFDRAGVTYSTQKITEGRKRPDFILPHIDAYHHTPDELVNEHVTMLAAKTTSKDRWRQALSEADRLKVKYLVTLEPAISENQTDEMRDAQLQLVVPEAVKKSYTTDQQEWLLNLSEFIALVKERQDLEWEQYIPTN